MSQHQEQFFSPVSFDTARSLCLTVASEQGWRASAIEKNTFTCLQQDGARQDHPVTVTILLQNHPQGTRVVLHGRSDRFGPVHSRYIRREVANLRDGIEHAAQHTLITMHQGRIQAKTLSPSRFPLFCFSPRHLTLTAIAVLFLFSIVTLSRGNVTYGEQYLAQYSPTTMLASNVLTPTLALSPTATRTPAPPTSAPATFTRTPSPLPPTATDTPANPPSHVAIGSITHGGNLRREPTIASDNVIGQVCPGDQVEFLEQRDRWYWIRLTRTDETCAPDRVATGAEGWANTVLLSDPTTRSEIAVEPSPTPTSTPASVPTAEPPSPPDLIASVFHGGNVRQIPDGEPILDQIHAGETVSLLQKTPDSVWYFMRNPRNIEGWVHHTLLTIAPDTAASVPTANQQQPE